MKQFVFSIFCVLICCAVVCAQETKSLKIVDQPKPALPLNYETLDAQVTIPLKVEFLESGEVGTVLPLTNTLVRNLTENAVDAARKIKFEPEIKDGKTVTVSKVVEYHYSWNGFWKNSSEKNIRTKDEKAEAILKKAVENLGGERYLQVKSQIGRGKFSVLRQGATISFQTFIDVIVLPDKERTEFKSFGTKNVQTNTGETGWIFDGDAEVINLQNDKQIGDFKRGINASLDNLLRRGWEGKAELIYVGRREAGVGRRNDVVKLAYEDGFAVEFEFSADGLPVKAIYQRTNPEGEDSKEEDRYAQFVDVQGIKTPFIIDHFSGGVHTSRINYESVEFNKSIPDSIFAKPNAAKELKKDLKL